MIRRLPSQPIQAHVPLTDGLAPIEGENSVDALEHDRFADGYREGYEAGEADARRDAEAELRALESQLRSRFEESTLDLEDARQRLLAMISSFAAADRARVADLEATVVEMSMLAITHLFGQQNEDRAVLQRLAAKMVSDHRVSAITLQVAERDREFLPDRLDGLLVEGVPSLPVGTCRIRTRSGDAETSLSQRLEALHLSLLEALGVVA